MVASAIGLSILCFLAVIVGSAAGAIDSQASGQGLWPLVTFLPVVGLPLGAILLVALILISGIRRGREAKDARK